MRQLLRIFILLAAGPVLTACSLPSWLQPIKLEVQQGNFVTQEMVAKLKPGMTKSQVRFALGTPLLSDPFHKDRWDYVFSLSQGGDLIQRRIVTVVFVDDKLQRVEGDVVAAQLSAEGVGETAKPPPERPATLSPESKK
jgi:outer membrane protein assembly factor BamE